jgi:hypothetical protein
MRKMTQMSKKNVAGQVQFQSPDGVSASPEIDRLVEEIIGRVADKWTLLLLELVALRNWSMESARRC